jgi:carbonic anhydrase
VQEIVRGVHHFQQTTFGTYKELYERLSHAQAPDALFITCSDSRVSPTHITHSEPGKLFLLQAAGNIVPPFGPHPGGEAATIEYALEVLGVHDIIVCGHSDCGALKALMKPPEALKHLPAVSALLGLGETTRRVMQQCYPDLQGAELLDTATKEHVLVQIENLQTHPSVRARLRDGRLRLHGWMYYIGTGEVLAFDAKTGQFEPLTSPEERPSEGAVSPP